jgi:hypothetical protein
MKLLFNLAARTEKTNAKEEKLRPLLLRQEVQGKPPNEYEPAGQLILSCR